ncbi:MAG: DUF951 domain-containing protein [Clostridia bacterium]|nr:DUF951 domain-containing protein [Clostridia bacterium]
MPEIKAIQVGDILKMKKKHPCGSSEMKVILLGSDIKIQCTGCGHVMMVPRVKLEKNIKAIISDKTENSI